MLEYNMFDTCLSTEKKTQPKPYKGDPKIPGIVTKNLFKIVVQV
jgi:hypothetical protein